MHGQISGTGSHHEICTRCGITAWLLPAALDADDLAEVGKLAEHRRTVNRDHFLVRAGEPLIRLYFVNSGSLKSTLPDTSGHAQLIGFALPGEVIGMGAIATGTHPENVIALEDASCCSIRYTELTHLGQNIHALQHHLHQVMSREITRNHDLMLMLGSMRAEERLAMFLLDLSKRYAERGYSGAQLRLSMSRRDIGSYLGLNLETVSRLLMRLDKERLLDVSGRDITIRDRARLQQINDASSQRLRKPRKAASAPPHRTEASRK